MLINKALQDKISIYRKQFEEGKPFKHVVIDNFFDPDVAQTLLQEFPLFDPQKAISETGTLGGKSVHENLGEISINYQILAEHLGSTAFLDCISQLTGIEKLINDETFYGGGTHENLNGQELDPHVDFNLDERRWYHRRLNVIIFLNKEWEESWGGCLELHSNPREPDENQITALLPLFNRCVIFETNEYSWHGFTKIQLPAEKQHLSRKSISIYLYTKERPEDELAPPHTTFYIHRPLPPHIQPGKVLTQEDYQEIKVLLKRRDDLIHFYQKKELENSSELENIKMQIKRYLALKHQNLWKLWHLWIKLKKSSFPLF
ncbi:2OG-Fe(II) oxygenase [Gloeothece verrucosa]|uniref:Proline hydroxylase-like protein n=1 Tax=Gloeothece verrucosa (strain PCC 7822) TaxID=497965 RepID=E0UBK0_GLOV7|nr:2OG-Fe(II) oxygenase [Gloeothece verrucosa]ADN13944.1 proline hydroxylase-like protein [Gloeothece verrucosa PCC 7822]